MKAKQYIKICSSLILTSCGFYKCYRFLKKKKHIILTFHKIHPSTERIISFDTCPSVSDKVFCQILSHLKINHEIVSLRYLCDNLSSRIPLAALTFDDGWRDNYRLAFPILKKNNLPATIFVTTGKIGSSVPFWQQELGAFFQSFANQRDVKSEQCIRDILGIQGTIGDIYSLYVNIVFLWKFMSNEERQDLLSQLSIRHVGQGRCFLSEQEIYEMSQNNIDFGSHTHNHSILPNECYAIVAEELMKSKKILEHIIQKDIDILAYPNGDLSSEVIAASKNTGYKFACTTENSRVGVKDEPHQLPRIDADWDNLCFKNGKLLKSIFDWVVK